MNVQDTDLGDLRIDLGNINQKGGYGGTGESAQKYEVNNANAARDDQPKEAPKQGGIFSCFSVEFYQPYFDVTTEDVKTRILATIDPRKNEFFETLQGRPDLYGPFWIYTTLIFALAASANFSNFIIASFDEGKTFQSKFNFVPTATAVIYGFGIAVPLIFTFLLRLFGSKVNYVDTLCIYGYSYFVLVPALIISVIPITILQWIALMAALGSSTWFLLNNYSHEMKKYVGNQRYILLAVLAGSQVVLFLVFRLKFFADIYGSAPKTL